MKNMLRYLVLLIGLSLLSTQSKGQKDRTCANIRFDGQCFKEYALSYPQDLGSYFMAPTKWSKKKWIINSSLLVAGGTLFFADEWIHKSTRFTSINENIIQYGFKNFGNGVYTMPLLAGMFVYGLAADDQNSFNTALMGGKSFLLATLITRTLKYSLNRSRPTASLNANIWQGPTNPFGNFSSIDLSFPSGHTTGAFAVASVLARNYKHKLWVPITAYSIATAVGLSRIYQGEHWSSDVLFGALIGYSVGSIVSKVDCNREASAFHFNGNGFSVLF